MTEYIPFISAVTVAVLTVIIAPLVRGEVDNRLLRRALRHAELRSKLENQPKARKNIDELLEEETAKLKAQELNRLSRKLNSINLTALIFVAVIGGGIVYLLVAWALSLVDPFWATVAWIVSVAVGLFVIGLASVGIKTLFEPKKDEIAKKPAEEAKKEDGQNAA